MDKVYWEFVANLDSMILSKGIFNHLKIREFFKKRNLDKRRQALELLRYSRYIDDSLQKIVKKTIRQSRKIKSPEGASISFVDTDLIEFPNYLLRLGKEEFEKLMHRPESIQDRRHWVSTKNIIRPKTSDLSPTLAFTTYINSLKYI